MAGVLNWTSQATLALCLTLSISMGYEIYSSIDPCPEGVKQGETWYPSNCERCTCFSNGIKQQYECVTCGRQGLQPQKGCYATPFHPDQPFPKCCTLREVCPGNPDYDIGNPSGGLIG